MSTSVSKSDWPGGSIPNFLISDEGARLDRVYPRLQAEEPRFAATIQRIAASAQLGMNRRMKDPAHAARLIGPAQLRHIALWHKMFDMLVELGQQAVAEAICTAASALATHRSRAIGRDMLKDYEAITAGFAARLGHWQLLDAEKDTVIGSLLDRLPPDRVEPMQRQIFKTTSSEIRAAQVKSWNLSRGLANAVHPPENSQLANLQLMAIALVANPRADQITQDARRMAQVLGDCMNLGGNPWLPPPDPSPREILRKFAALKKELGATGQEIASRDEKIQALQSQLDATGLEVEGLRSASDTLKEIGREISRSKRHHHKMAAIGIAIDGREESSGDLREQLEVLLTVIGPHCRSEDLIGLVDAKTMGIFLPETDLEAGRIFSERIRDAIRQGFGMPPILMYLTSLEREEGNTAQSLAVSISRAIDGMSKDKAGPNFAVNTTGKMAWR